MKINADNKNREFIYHGIITGDEQIGPWRKEAEEYVENPTKTEGLLSRALRKAEINKKNEAFQTIWTQIQLLFSLVRDWANGSYKNISKSTIAIIIAGLLYFVSPLDIIPDWVVGLGLVDDITVLGLIINQLNKELHRYKLWKNNF